MAEIEKPIGTNKCFYCGRSKVMMISGSIVDTFLLPKYSNKGLSVCNPCSRKIEAISNKNPERCLQDAAIDFDFYVKLSPAEKCNDCNDESQWETSYPHFQLVKPGIYKYQNNDDLVRHNFHKLIDLLDSIPQHRLIDEVNQVYDSLHNHTDLLEIDFVSDNDKEGDDSDCVFDLSDIKD